MSHRDPFFCYAEFVGITLLAVLFLLALPNRFLKVCVPTLSAAFLKINLPLTTSAISGAANYNNSAPTRFAAGTIYLRRNGVAVFPITCANAMNPRQRCWPIPPQNVISTCLEATIL